MLLSKTRNYDAPDWTMYSLDRKDRRWINNFGSEARREENEKERSLEASTTSGNSLECEWELLLHKPEHVLKTEKVSRVV